VPGYDAGLAAEYWRDGVYDEKTASRALIEQRWTEGWAGERISLGARP
jgi:hypothetical protein